MGTLSSSLSGGFFHENSEWLFSLLTWFFSNLSDDSLLAGLDLGYLTRLLVTFRVHAGPGEVTATEREGNSMSREAARRGWEEEGCWLNWHAVI